MVIAQLVAKLVRHISKLLTTFASGITVTMRVLLARISAACEPSRVKMKRGTSGRTAALGESEFPHPFVHHGDRSYG